MEAKRYTVEKEYELTRLDKFLNEMEEDLSRSRIQSLIDEESILVNGKKTKANYKLTYTNL